MCITSVVTGWTKFIKFISSEFLQNGSENAEKVRNISFLWSVASSEKKVIR